MGKVFSGVLGWGVGTCSVAVTLWSVSRKIWTGRRNFFLVGWKLVLGVRSGQSDPWVAVETQMFQKKTRPLHVVSVTPAGRASASWLRVSCRELSSSTTAPPWPPPPLFQGKTCFMLTNQRRKDWSCVCELRQASDTSQHSLGSVLNCSTRGALESIHNIGENPF